MPSRNVIKQFDVDSMYHVYNRGVDKRIIFQDERDYAVFLSFLKYALLTNAERSAADQVEANLLSEAQRFNLRRQGLEGKVDLVAFCLMPNHFHLLLYQHDVEAITKLMRSVATGYSMYFNKRHGRVGSLFQGVYKASHISDEPYWQHISRYIHLNSLDLGVDFKDYNYSSYKFYAEKAQAEWLKPELGMNGMSAKGYEAFLEDWIPYRKDLLDVKAMLANSKELK